nr:DNA replication licensing factor MCM3-like [Cherax quadricarinatus]
MATTADVIIDQRIRDIQREYLEFLEDDEDSGLYSELVRDMIEDGECRLIVSINDLRKKNSQRVTGLLNCAYEEVPAFHRALKEYVASVDANYAKNKEELFVGFEGSFGSKHVSPRSLTARNLGNLVCVEGIVTKCSLVRPKVVRSVHYCPTTKKTLERRYTDMTSYEPYPSSALYPTKDEDGNLLETEYGLCIYKDHQTITIQEMPEKAPAGQLPRSVDIVLDNDLVDKCKPGDRVQVNVTNLHTFISVFRCLNKHYTTILKLVLLFQTQPVTARALETLIRLSTAHSKSRLSRYVTVQDAEAAIEMVSYAYFKKVMERKKRRKNDEESDTEPEEEDDNREEEEGGRKRKRRGTGEAEKKTKKVKKTKKQPGDEGYDPYDIESAEEEGEAMSPTPASVRSSVSRASRTSEAASSTTTPKEISTERLAAFKVSLTKLFKEERIQTVAVSKVKKFLSDEHASQPFTTDEFDAAIARMTDDNQLMVADDMIFLM